MAEKAAIADDLIRPAVRLALALQRHAFSNVCVLEGGFPALVEQLMTQRGFVEPIILNHDTEKWKKFLVSSGRLSASSGKKPINSTHRNTNNPVGCASTDISHHSVSSSNSIGIGLERVKDGRTNETKNYPGSAASLLSAAIAAKKTKDELSELEVAQMAYQVNLDIYVYTKSIDLTFFI